MDNDKAKSNRNVQLDNKNNTDHSLKAKSKNSMEIVGTLFAHVCTVGAL